MTNDESGLKWLHRVLITGMLLMGLGMVAVGCWGCNFIKAASYFLQPTSEQVNPEFNRLDGKLVLIYVWAPPEITWDYPKLRLDLSAYLGDYLQQKMPKVRMVDPLKVERYLEQQNTLEQDPADLGRQFKADMVLHLSVFEFSIRDPDMAHFYRGRLGSSVQVYDMAKAPEPERIPLQDAKVVVPEDAPIGVENVTAASMRQMTYDAFTVEVGKKFHRWERPIE
jgi:hypothetical protein